MMTKLLKSLQNSIMTIKIDVVNKPFLINDESLEIGNVQQVKKRLFLIQLQRLSKRASCNKNMKKQQSELTL